MSERSPNLIDLISYEEEQELIEQLKGLKSDHEIDFIIHFQERYRYDNILLEASSFYETNKMDKLKEGILLLVNPKIKEFSFYWGAESSTDESFFNDLTLEISEYFSRNQMNDGLSYAIRSLKNKAGLRL